MKNLFAFSYPATSSTKVATVRSMKWVVLGRDRSIPHVGRKAYHFLMGLICFGLYAFVLDRTGALLALATVGGLFLTLDVLRLKVPAVNALALQFFGNLMRREELKTLSANSYYVIGLFVITLLFSKPIVLLSVLFLAVGDPIAAIVGTLHGKHRLFGKKSLEGTLANFFLSGIAAFIVGESYFHFSAEQAILLAFVGGAISAVSELLPLPLNDNLTIPIVSSVLLACVSQILPIL